MESHDCTKAMEYFEIARLTTKDIELAAKASFMAARCQQRMYYTSKDCKYNSYGNKIPDFPEEYQTYFKLLKENL